MTKNTTKTAVRDTGKRMMGLDLGDPYSDYSTLDAAGENLESGRVNTSRKTLEKRFGGQEGVRVVIDASATFNV
jgi:hypothetical protein